MKVAYRPYRCSACGHEKSIQTNHEGRCADWCPGCSWKVGAHEIAMNYGGRAYRWFDFAPICDEGCTNREHCEHPAPGYRYRDYPGQGAR